MNALCLSDTALMYVWLSSNVRLAHTYGPYIRHWADKSNYADVLPKNELRVRSPEKDEDYTELFKAICFHNGHSGL